MGLDVLYIMTMLSILCVYIFILCIFYSVQGESFFLMLFMEVNEYNLIKNGVAYLKLLHIIQSWPGIKL